MACCIRKAVQVKSPLILQANGLFVFLSLSLFAPID